MNKNLLIIALLAIIAAGGWYFYQQQQHTQTASINLPGGKNISITTHD